MSCTRSQSGDHDEFEEHTVWELLAAAGPSATVWAVARKIYPTRRRRRDAPPPSHPPSAPSSHLPSSHDTMMILNEHKSSTFLDREYRLE